MIPDKIRLRAQARKLGVKGYDKMSDDELAAAVGEKSGAPRQKARKLNATRKSTSVKKSATKKTSSATKRSSTKKTAPSQRKSATKKVSTSPKRGSSTKSSPANKKSTSRKSSSKTTAAKGKAKRATSGNSTSEAPIRRRSYQAGHVGKGGYTNLDRGGIDWTIESNVGRTGKRKMVLDSLRENDGDYALVFVALREHATEWYPNALNAYPQSPSKLAAAERQLRWLIGRVAYDYAFKTAQHQGRRAEATKTSKPKTSTRKTSQKATGAAEKPRTARRAVKSSSAVSRAKKGVARRGAAPRRGRAR